MYHRRRVGSEQGEEGGGVQDAGSRCLKLRGLADDVATLLVLGTAELRLNAAPTSVFGSFDEVLLARVAPGRDLLTV
jgi:hypothetical protein